MAAVRPAARGALQLGDDGWSTAAHQQRLPAQQQRRSSSAHSPLSRVAGAVGCRANATRAAASCKAPAHACRQSGTHSQQQGAMQEFGGGTDHGCCLAWLAPSSPARPLSLSPTRSPRPPRPSPRPPRPRPAGKPGAARRTSAPARRAVSASLRFWSSAYTHHAASRRSRRSGSTAAQQGEPHQDTVLMRGGGVAAAGACVRLRPRALARVSWLV
jgi:hypothetical protein